MENMTLRRPLTQTLPVGIRWMLAQAVARLRSVPATTVAEYATTLVAEQATPVRSSRHDDAQPYPQRWTPVRPGMRADAAMRLSPYGSAPRVRLRVEAGTHLLEHCER